LAGCESASDVLRHLKADLHIRVSFRYYRRKTGLPGKSKLAIIHLPKSKSPWWACCTQVAGNQFPETPNSGRYRGRRLTGNGHSECLKACQSIADGSVMCYRTMLQTRCESTRAGP
jgi:hypothetical protein